MRRHACVLLLAVASAACDREPPPRSTGPPPWKDWLTIASNGDAYAQAKVGDLYLYGITIPRDTVKAATWYRMAAKQGNPIAQHRLGLLAYSEGDYTCAAEWFQLAADQGYVDAYGSLGWLYFKGQGVPKDQAKAERLWERASRRTPKQ